MKAWQMIDELTAAGFTRDTKPRRTGTHEKWTAPDGHAVILPYRRESDDLSPAVVASVRGMIKGRRRR